MMNFSVINLHNFQLYFTASLFPWPILVGGRAILYQLAVKINKKVQPADLHLAPAKGFGLQPRLSRPLVKKRIFLALFGTLWNFLLILGTIWFFCEGGIF